MNDKAWIGITAVSLVLAGCDGGSNEDIKKWMAEESKNLKGRVEKIEEPKKFVAFKYEAEKEVDPFSGSRISQIAEDVSLYLKVGSPYRKVLPIIWDQARRTEQYDLLISGLSQIRDVVSPVIIAQPAYMEPATNGDASVV